ncbi:MAG: pilus assembly PilX N-terminal domain-containing protein [Acidobacteriota bacterium]|nr:pilus assembly PilX N-terminal domain-containing protein [Acidobacteriota bacterium]MDH3784693.1 pilus assembly PilX N-terminal domain-containing protein [Acidobacteriota bacterium]
MPNTIKRILPRKQDGSIDERGSALVMAIFVLVLLTTIGSALLFVSQNEVRMSGADTNSKASFYIAEAGLEAGRMTLYNTNEGESFDDDLAAAADDGTFDFSVLTISATYGSDGDVNGFTYGADQPLIGPVAFGDGYFVAFLTNDIVDEAIDPLLDTNERVVLTGVGAGPDGSFEVVQAIIEIRDLLPPTPPAAVTLLGPTPFFDSGDSSAKRYVGDDCDGTGVPGYYVPALGAIGASAEASGEAGMHTNPDYEANGLPDSDTFADLTDWSSEPALGVYGADIDPAWNVCTNLLEYVDLVRESADVVCTPPAACAWPASSPDRVVFIDGDWTIGPGVQDGLLFVTGQLNLHGQATWNGLIFVVGEGRMVAYGGGNGEKSGSTIVADIAGPDNIFGNADDCTGGDGGFDSVHYDDAGGGNSDTVYCSVDIEASMPIPPYDILEFRQY